MRIYEELEKNQKKTGFYRSEEYLFFRDNASILSSINLYASLNNSSSTFDVIRANILIMALENKRYIERQYVALTKQYGVTDEEKIKLLILSSANDLPFLMYRGQRIFVPALPYSLNRIYNNDFYRLGTDPYKRLVLNYEAAVIDPFDYYGQSIYVSLFTKLKPVLEDKDGLACYDDDANALYIINKEGRLDAKICLFDNGVENIDKNDIINRITPIAKAYFAYDRDEFLQALANSGCYSEQFMARLWKKESRKKSRQEGK